MRFPLSLLPKKNRRERSLGATIIETAIGIPIFLMFVLSMVEVLWFFHVKISLEYAAQQAVDLASKLPFETAMDQPSCSKPENTNRCKAFKENLDKVQEAAWHDTNLVASHSGEGGAVTLRSFIPYTQADIKSAMVSTWITGLSYEVALVRPGESLRYKGSSEPKWQHPFRPDDSLVGEVAGAGWPTAKKNETWEGIMAETPLAVHIEALYTPLTPFFKSVVGRLRISVTQFGFRITGQKPIAAPYVAAPAQTPPTPVTPGPRPTPVTPPSNPLCPVPVNNPCISNQKYCCQNKGACGICASDWGCLIDEQCKKT